MSRLKREVINFKIDENVTLLQHISKENSLLNYVEVQVFKLAPGGSLTVTTEDREVCAVALTGKYKMCEGEHLFNSVGTRKSVFERIPTDSVYVPCKKELKIDCLEPGNIILCYTPSSDNKKVTTLIRANENSIEARGKYNNKRLVHNILDDQSEIAENLLVVEVYTDSANWSSYPPHKHDQDNLPHESFLEETYYHEMDSDKGFVYQRVYTDDRILDETMAVYNQEMVIVPKGYHPVSVPDGYNGYYLNIMAGPTKIWKFNNEKDHEWIINRD